MRRFVLAACAGFLLTAFACKKEPSGVATVKSLAAEDVRKFDLLAIKAAWEQYSTKSKGSATTASEGVKAAFEGRFPDVETYVKNDVMVTVAANDAEVAYIIRGTETGLDLASGAGNIWRDIYALPVEVGTKTVAGATRKLLAASGFHRTATDVRAILTDNGAIAKHKGKQQFFIGHSLGGAAAQILLYVMARNGELTTEAPRTPRVFAYGAPIAGNRSLYQEIFALAIVRKFFHPDDFVPRLPYDEALLGLLFGKTYYETDDINVVTGARRTLADKFFSVKGLDPHLKYVEALTALAENGAVDNGGGQVYADAGQDAQDLQVKAEAAYTTSSNPALQAGISCRNFIKEDALGGFNALNNCSECCSGKKFSGNQMYPLCSQSWKSCVLSCGEAFGKNHASFFGNTELVKFRDDKCKGVADVPEPTEPTDRCCKVCRKAQKWGAFGWGDCGEWVCGAQVYHEVKDQIFPGSSSAMSVCDKGTKLSDFRMLVKIWEDGKTPGCENLPKSQCQGVPHPAWGL